MENDENVDLPALRHAFELPEENNFSEFRLALHNIVLHWLQSDLEKLRRILYRIDVSEALARKAFELEDSVAIAERLTDLLIDRELQKLRNRGTSSQGDWMDL